MGATTTQTCYVYDGNQIVMQFERQGTGVGGQGSGALTGSDLSHRYLWGPAVDQLLAQESPLLLGEGQGYDLSQPGDVAWTLGDNLNTVRDLAVYNSGTDVTSVVNHRVFSAYGQLLSQTDLSGARPAPATVDCLFGYTGRPLDQATGLQNNNARWYDAITGRWLSEDHIWDGVNLYRYVGNGPTNAADPTGLGFMYYLEPVSGPAGNGVGGNGGAVVNAGGGFEIPFVLYSAPPSAYLPANPAQTTARWWNPFSWYESAPKGCFSVGRPLPPPNSAEITPLCSTGNIAQDRINRWQYDMFLQWQYDMFPQGYPGPGWGWSGWSNGIPPGAWSAFQQMQSIQQINVPQSPAPISGP